MLKVLMPMISAQSQHHKDVAQILLLHKIERKRRKDRAAEPGVPFHSMEMER